MREGTRVLLVEADADERDRLATHIEAAGHEVSLCPGPSAPDYTCIGARGERCPLADEASVVVLDMSLASEAVVAGTPAEELMGMYLFAGQRIVVLGSYPGADVPGQMIRLRRHPDPEVLLGAIVYLANA